MIVRPATPGAWVDASTPLSRAGVKALVARGVVGVVRTLPLPGNDPRGDLQADELQMLTEEGLEVSAYQHVRGFLPHAPLWMPRAHDGAADAKHACDYASSVGLPVGMHLWQDLEAVDGTRDEAWRYTVAWGAGCTVLGYRAALYVGYCVPLSNVDLYQLPDHDRYWSDPGHRIVAVRACCVQQGRSVPAMGPLPALDEDTVRPDALGDLPLVCAAG